MKPKRHPDDKRIQSCPKCNSTKLAVNVSDGLMTCQRCGYKNLPNKKGKQLVTDFKRADDRDE